MQVDHTHVVGITGTGKTSLLKELIYYDDRSVLLDDPKKKKWAGITYYAKDIEDLARVSNDSENVLTVSDESDMSIGLYPSKPVKIMATQGREWGAELIMVSHTYKDINKSMRTSCTQIYLFAVCTEDAKLAAQEYLCKDLLNAPRLKKGFCLHHVKMTDDPSAKLLWIFDGPRPKNPYRKIDE